MSRLGITFEEVAEAAFTIHNNGETPTIDKVRAYLGGTGSNTTISKYLNAWRQETPPSSEKEVKLLPGCGSDGCSTSMAANARENRC